MSGRPSVFPRLCSACLSVCVRVFVLCSVSVCFSPRATQIFASFERDPVDLFVCLRTGGGALAGGWLPPAPPPVPVRHLCLFFYFVAAVAKIFRVFFLEILGARGAGVRERLGVSLLLFLCSEPVFLPP